MTGDSIARTTSMPQVSVTLVWEEVACFAQKAKVCHCRGSNCRFAFTNLHGELCFRANLTSRASPQLCYRSNVVMTGVMEVVIDAVVAPRTVDDLEGTSSTPAPLYRQVGSQVPTPRSGQI